MTEYIANSTLPNGGKSCSMTSGLRPRLAFQQKRYIRSRREYLDLSNVGVFALLVVLDDANLNHVCLDGLRPRFLVHKHGNINPSVGFCRIDRGKILQV